MVHREPPDYWQGYHGDDRYHGRVRYGEGGGALRELRDYVGSGSTGSFVVFDAIRFTSAGTVGTDESSQVIPLESIIDIKKTYPNPFNPQVTVEYEIRASGQVGIHIRDLKGKHIKTINKK